MKTVLKWPGGKENELLTIREYIPNYNGRYVEPFVGGGAVFFDTTKKKCYINDKSVELINLYNCIKRQDKDMAACIQLFYDEFKYLGTIVKENPDDILLLYHSKITIDDFINKHNNIFSRIANECSDIFVKEIKKNLKNKISRSQKLEYEHGCIPDADRKDNIEAALKSAYYMYIRHLFNNQQSLSSGQKAAVFFFIREYCYSSMFRYNKDGDFNVPYGGISYNKKDFQKKIDYLLSDEVFQKLQTTHIENLDFEEFLMKLNLTNEDFLFLDPPYDSNFSTYAQNIFGPCEQIRLFEFLKNTPAKSMLIIKNTEFIYNLYKDDFYISMFDKKYLVSFKNRNNRSVKHLIITNYKIEA